MDVSQFVTQSFLTIVLLIGGVVVVAYLDTVQDVRIPLCFVITKDLCTAW